MGAWMDEWLVLRCPERGWGPSPAQSSGGMERSSGSTDISGQNQQGLGGLRGREGSRVMSRFLAWRLGKILALLGRSDVGEKVMRSFLDMGPWFGGGRCGDGGKV